MCVGAWSILAIGADDKLFNFRKSGENIILILKSFLQFFRKTNYTNLPST